MAIKILTVENDANVGALLQIRLKKAGFQVISASNGKEGIELARIATPDVVISSVRMPGLDGLTLTRELKAQSEAAPLVILLTALNSDGDIAAGFQAGADDYLIKPFSPLVLIERVRINLIRSGRAMPAQMVSEGSDD